MTFNFNKHALQHVTASMVARIRLLVTFFLLCTSALCFADNPILIITTSDSNYQKQLSRSIQAELILDSRESEIAEADHLDDHSIDNIELVVAIGRSSVSIIRKKSYRTAILDALTDDSKNKNSPGRPVHEPVIYMTQPLCRQFRLIKALKPDWKTVGLLISEENKTRVSTLSACASKYGLTTRTETINDNSNLISALNAVLNNSDVLLSLPDPDIYNSHTIKSILLTSYRHRIPVIGFSESFANAGAIAAVHTSAEQLATQIAKIVADYFKNDRSFSKAEYYPSNFTVTTNRQVARSLEIELDDNKAIESILKKMEKGDE